MSVTRTVGYSFGVHGGPDTCTGRRTNVTQAGTLTTTAYCNGLTNLNGACNNYFSNSHIIYDRTNVQYYSAGSCVSPGSCSCTKNGFYGNGHTYGMCTSMSNCDIEVCTNSYNQYCNRCSGRVHDSVGYRAYRNYNGNCHQACCWRSDSTRCYPGSCSSSSCSCTGGFSGGQCQTIDTYPTIHNNYLYIVQGGTMYSPHNVNAGPTQSTKWTNYNNPSNLNFRFQTSYSISAPTYHNYVSGFSVGLTAARFYLYQQRNGGNIRTYSYTCPSAGSQGSPRTSMLTCTSDISPSSYLSLPMNHLDVLLFYCQADNGGYVVVQNHESGGSNTYYYNGKTQSYSFTFTIDIVDPYHRYSGTTCVNQMLDVADVAVSSPVTLTWSNWVDDNSGVGSFTLTTHKLVYSGGQLVKDSHHSTVSKSSGSTSHSLSMSTSGMYQTVITCHDVATNYKKARRLFLYDPISTITTHTGVLRVTTAAVNTTWVWQHSLAPVTVDWADRYWNSFHYNNKLLHVVDSESEMETNYDDYENTRPKTAITNVWGIVSFTTSYSKDHSGGATLSLPSTGNFVTESDLDQTRTFDPSVVDGDTVRFWVRAYDLRDYSYSYTESVTVHTDTSPPVIENLWLTQQNYLQLYVHDSLDLAGMTIEWDAYDYHSGINSIYWRLYDNFTGSDLDHGYAQESTQGSTSTISQCNSVYSGYARGADCYCTGPVGCYHKQYQITVTNHANLITVLTEQITIDNSPPEGGHVMDSSSGSDDEDFRSDRNLQAHWEGFFDKESSVRFYQNGWDTSCLSASNFDEHSPSNKVTQTSNTYASYTAPSWNTKYYCTVVAYNEALAKSDPVCSDGIIADSNTPSISKIWVEGVSIPPGRIRVGNDVYLIESDRMRVAVDSPTSSCRSSSYSVSSFYLDHFPSRSHDGGNTDLTIDSATACAYDALDTDFLSRFYFIYDGHLYLNWTSSDSVSHLTEQYVALGTSSSWGTRNILDWQATNNQNHYQLYIPNINEGTSFYIHVKAVDAVGRYTVRTIGPGIVHKTSAPSYSQTPSFALTSNYFKASWSTSYLSDNEKYHLTYKVAFEDVTTGELVYNYHEPVSGQSCTVSSPKTATCTSIPTSDLLTEIHEGHQYRAILQVTNLANITYSKVSSTYTHRTEYPETGVIYEVVPDGEQTLLGISNTENTDFQISTTSLKVRWYGFETRWHTVSYQVALGTSPGSNNVVNWRSVSGGNLEYTFTGLSLATDYVYYCRLRAYTSVGSRYINSDGVKIVQAGRTVSGVTINDGDGDCHHQYNDQPVGFSALHQTHALSVSCPTDVDYQPMMNMFGAYWSMSSTNKARFPDIQWSIDVYNNSLATWEQHRSWEAISRQEQVYATGLSLLPGEKYRSSVQFCVGNACSNTLNSDGVTITPNAPISGTLSVEYTLSGATGTLIAEFEKFYGPDIDDLTQAQAAIAGYQYALPDNTHDSKLLDDWQNVVVSPINSTFNRITLTFNPATDFSVCRRIAIKGYNYVGMSATISREIQNCTAYNPLLIVPNKVVDAVGPQAGDLDYVGDSIVLEQNAEWPTPDADYTPYTNVISAVWPKLRHRNYTYAVIRLTGTWDNTHYDGSNHLTTIDPCNYANVLVCGETTHEYVNVYFSSGSLLTHGRRYAVSVHAEATQIVHEKWVEDLDEVGVCSTGITEDTTAPTSGRVWLANLRNTMYSPYTNEATLQWDGFLDVEQNNYASHDSSISHYQVALGSIEYGEDVLKFYDVGVINQIKLVNLNLAEGSMFYASVKAFDFTGKSTVVTSSGFIVDNTPPIVTNAQFQFDYKYLTATNTLSLCWPNMFVDPESSIASYKYAVGGRPGHTDRLDFTSTSTSTCGSSSMANNLVDGKAYYVTVMAYNGAGLYNISISKPIVVSVNGPTAGTVFDGSSSGRSSTSQDDDYKSSVGSPLEAYWQWFYSPYSPVVYYKVSLGSCSGCDDVVKDRYVGLRTEIIYDDVEISHGTRYYTPVTTCDILERCASATSDGVLVDVTAPSPGVVQDGTFSEDIEFQSARDFLGAKWYRFHDPEFLLVSYHWSAGTSAGSTDIMSWTALKFTEIAYYASFSPNLPTGSRIYINVRATNNAGLTTVASSNGFIVDTSAPTADFQPRLLGGIGTTDSATLISRDAFRVEWSFTDSQSSIDYYSVSLKSSQENDY
ncbi:hypothetical protein RRG08_010055 [Elysia crispata]|uniref:Uncharacterized protein n=1 Tax=Elysia crispata TaxID=231223 RepID=A0AAE1B8Y7_9GAST|nr:hypothetical protein RRG08_010055 [Elysia crispata]